VRDVSAPPSLSVDLNRDYVHQIEVADAFETADSFAVELRNHGRAVHVHFRLDDDLSEAASLAANNHYVDSEASRTVEIAAGPVRSPVTGRLEIVTGYGAETAYVSVTIRPASEEQSTIEVDESLATPSRSEPEPALLDRLDANRTLPLVALAAGAVVLALLAAVLVQSPPVLLAVAVVVLGVAAALWLAVSPG
jgi:hypothetical protein